MDQPKNLAKPPPTPREAKLAEALRANLRRRKLAPPSKTPQADMPPPQSQDHD